MTDKEIKSGLSIDIDNLSPDEMRQMLHDLNARLRELEKQNEALHQDECGEKLNTLALHMSLAQRISRTGSFEYNIVTNEVIWSDEMFRIFGLLPQSTPLTYEDVRNRIHPDDRDLHLQQTQNIINTGSYNFEHRVVWDDGSIHYILGTAEMQYDEDGNSVMMLGTAQDITESKQIEESLRQSESTLRLFIENAPAAIAMFDDKMNYLVASLRWMTDYNLGERDVIGISHYEIFPEISDSWKTVHQRGLAGEVIQENEDSFLRADGSTQWLKWEVRPWYKVDQTVGGIIIFSEDITKQKQAERLLIESENRYRTLVEQASDGIYMVDDNGNYVDVNTSGYTMLGYTREEMLQLNVRDVASVDELDKQHLLLSTLRIRQSILTERNLRRKDSTIFPVEINVNKLADGHALGIVRDITERKKTEQALIESREKLRLYLVNSPMAVIEWDDNFVVTRWSGEAEKIFEWSESETIGKSIMELDLIFEGDEEAIQDVMVQLTNSKSKYVVSTNRNYTKNRRVIYCEWYNSISYDSNGKMVSVMSQVLDITERKHTEELLCESEEKFKLISKLSPVGIYTTLPNGECQYANEFWCKMAGLTFNEALGMGWIQGIHPDDREMVFDNWIRMVESRGKWGQEYRFMDKAGSITWVYGIATPKEDLEGNIIGFIGVNVDITERKQTEKALREQEEMLNLIFNTVPDPITIIRKDDGVCTQINESFTKVTGWVETDIVGKASKENNIWVNDENRIKIVENLIKNGYVENYEAEFRHKKIIRL
jgi:PAS domain S-box-containing protein